MMKAFKLSDLVNSMDIGLSFPLAEENKKSPLKERMRGIFLPLLILAIIPFQTLSAQTHTETIRRTAQFQDSANPSNRLQIYNINGGVTVDGYDGKVIQITAKKRIETYQQSDLDRALEELQFVVEENGDQVLIYLDAPFIEVKRYDEKIGYRIDNWDQDYDFLYDITIKLPQHTKLKASTINRGKVVINNVLANQLSANNVNGEIELNDVSGKTEAATVNGDIRARYVSNPTGNSTYETINGTIEVFYPENLGADIRFQSLHGDLYTDFKNIKRLNTQVEQMKDKRGGAISYRVDKFSPVRIGEGGPEFRFEVLNGDVYIKRIKS